MNLISQKQPTRTSRRRSRASLESLESRNLLTAMLQVIHNSPYEAAAEVDVYVNDDLLLDNFAFRDATPFTEPVFPNCWRRPAISALSRSSSSFHLASSEPSPPFSPAIT